MQDYRAGEHNAEAIAAEYQTRKAVQDYRQGERGEYVTPSQPTSWWQQAWNAMTGTLSAPKTGKSNLAVPAKILGDGPFLIGVFVITVIVLATIDPWRRHGMSSEPNCKDTYAVCFENSQRLSLRNGQVLDTQQFNEMLDTIHEDLNSSWRTSFDPGRAAYDTPFWNGNPRFGKPIYGNEVVCLNDKCSPRSAVNYVAQGMYSAHTGQSLEDAKELANRWNKWIWGHDAAEDELYWLEYGYKAEQERNTVSP